MKRSKNTVKKPITELKLNPNNPRTELDVPAMMDDILQHGRIVEPLHVQEETGIVMRGNRRLSAALKLLEDPKLPSNVKEAISKLDCIVYSEMSDREFTEIVFDHGSARPLGCAEIVVAIWALQKQMYNEVEIATVMYQLLARYTGNTQKAHQAQQIPPGEARTKFLKDWLHGTLGQYIMLAYSLGERVRRQVVLTETEKDRELTAPEKLEKKWTTNRGRIKELAAEKKKDESAADGGKGWSPETGGVNFNAKIEEFEKIERGEGVTPKARKYTPTEMKANADSSASKAMRLAYLHCAGQLKDGEKAELDAVDAETSRKDKLQRQALEFVDRIDLSGTFGGTEVQGLINQFLTGTEVTFREYVQRFVVAPVEASASK